LRSKETLKALDDGWVLTTVLLIYCSIMVDQELLNQRSLLWTFQKF